MHALEVNLHTQMLSYLQTKEKKQNKTQQVSLTLIKGFVTW